MVAVQRPQWFNEWMNHPNEHMGFGGDEMVMPFGDNHNAMWSKKEEIRLLHSEVFYKKRKHLDT
ncbi:hypothetical protein ACSBR2_018478 [Camellia fascicularis]